MAAEICSARAVYISVGNVFADCTCAFSFFRNKGIL